jgi:hypothetical protein
VDVNISVAVPLAVFATSGVRGGAFGDVHSLRPLRIGGGNSASAGDCGDRGALLAEAERDEMRLGREVPTGEVVNARAWAAAFEALPLLGAVVFSCLPLSSRAILLRVGPFGEGAGRSRCEGMGVSGTSICSEYRRKMRLGREMPTGEVVDARGWVAAFEVLPLPGAVVFSCLPLSLRAILLRVGPFGEGVGRSRCEGMGVGGTSICSEYRRAISRAL